jgi:hypothetical protein
MFTIAIVVPISAVAWPKEYISQHPWALAVRENG